MPRRGLLIEYDYCTGCLACVVACKQEHNYPVGIGGIKVNEIVTESADHVKVDYLPILTRYCDLCVKRVKEGEQPACVKHCQSFCIMYGTVSKLAKAMEGKPGSGIFVPR